LLRKSMGVHLANAPMRFAPPNGIAYFEALGWRGRQSALDFPRGRAIAALAMVPEIFLLFPEPDPRKLGNARWSGVVQLGRPDR